MATTRSRRRTLVVLLVFTVGIGSALGPGGPAAAAATSRPLCRTAAFTGITVAFRTVFDRAATPTVDQRAALVAADPSRASNLVAFLGRWLATPGGRGESLTFGDVRCRGGRATVDYKLVLNGTVLSDVLPLGHAVRVGNDWKVTLSTLCGRAALNEPTLASTVPCSR